MRRVNLGDSIEELSKAFDGKLTSACGWNSHQQRAGGTRKHNHERYWIHSQVEHEAPEKQTLVKKIFLMNIVTILNLDLLYSILT